MLDYHIHTRLCNHADGTMQDYVRRAVSIGLQEICFLDHLTLADRGKNSSMALNEVGLYFQAAQNLKQAYSDRIAVKVGLETDFDRQHADCYREISQTFAFDVIGSSIHALGAVDVVSGNTDWACGRLDCDIIYKEYLARLIEMLDQDYFDVICHIDLVKKFGHLPNNSYTSQIEKIVDKIKRKNIVVEVNTSGFSHPAGEPYPGSELIEMLADAGVGLTMGSDAHRPEELGRYFERTSDLLQRFGVNELVAFSGRSRYAVPLMERDLHL